MFKRYVEDAGAGQRGGTGRSWPGSSHSSWAEALRIGLQSAIAGTAALLATRAIGNDNAFLAVISAVLVLQSNRDETFGSGQSRVVGTLIGSATGAAALALDPTGEMPLVLGLVMFAMGGLSVWRPQWRYGIVAAAGLAVGSDLPFWEAAQQRGIAILLGAGIGIAVGLAIWPRSARKIVLQRLQDALGGCRDLLDEAITAAAQGGEPRLAGLHRSVARDVAVARQKAESFRLGRKQSKRALIAAVHKVERLWHSLIILDRLGRARDGGDPVVGPTARTVSRFNQAACAAIGRLADLRRISDGQRASLDEACRSLPGRPAPRQDASEAMEMMALAYGLHQVRRNLGEIDEALAALSPSMVAFSESSGEST